MSITPSFIMPSPLSEGGFEVSISVGYETPSVVRLFNAELSERNDGELALSVRHPVARDSDSSPCYVALFELVPTKTTYAGEVVFIYGYLKSWAYADPQMILKEYQEKGHAPYVPAGPNRPSSLSPNVTATRASVMLSASPSSADIELAKLKEWQDSVYAYMKYNHEQNAHHFDMNLQDFIDGSTTAGQLFKSEQ